MTAQVTNANIITFITTDPRSVGFSAIRTAHPGEDAPLLAAANSVTGPGAGTVGGDPISSTAFFDLIDADEFDAFTTIQLAKLNTIMAPGSVNLGATATQEKLNTLLANASTSLAAVTALFTRPASPWEVYFGKGNQASGDLLDNARNSGSGSNF